MIRDEIREFAGWIKGYDSALHAIVRLWVSFCVIWQTSGWLSTKCSHDLIYILLRLADPFWRIHCKSGMVRNMETHLGAHCNGIGDR